MVKPIPSRFNPDLLARDSSQYSVTLPLGQFSRLSEFLREGASLAGGEAGADNAGEMQAIFRFSRRKDVIVVAGRLTTRYQLQCQRCLGTMTHDVDAPFELTFAKSEQAAHDMPDEVDPVVLDETGSIHVVDLFEDELILHVPTVPRHDTVEECDASEHLVVATETEHDLPTEADAVKKKNPFEVLKNLDLN